MFDQMFFVFLLCLTLGLIRGEEHNAGYYVKRGQVGLVQPVYLGSNQPASLPSDMQDSRLGQARAVKTDMTEELEEMSKFAGTMLRYFDFNSGDQSWMGNVLQDMVSSEEGRSKLGEFLQWKGDLLQPLALLALTALSLYTFSQILLVLAPSAGRTYSSLSSTLATALQALYDQLILVKDFKLDAINSLGDLLFGGGEDPVDASRRRRAVDELSNVVFSAIRKYQNKE